MLQPSMPPEYTPNLHSLITEARILGLRDDVVLGAWDFTPRSGGCADCHRRCCTRHLTQAILLQEGAGFCHNRHIFP